jgi:hypothetical protein
VVIYHPKADGAIGHDAIDVSWRKEVFTEIGQDSAKPDFIDEKLEHRIDWRKRYMAVSAAFYRYCGWLKNCGMMGRRAGISI